MAYLSSVSVTYTCMWSDWSAKERLFINLNSNNKSNNKKKESMYFGYE